MAFRRIHNKIKENNSNYNYNCKRATYNNIINYNKAYLAKVNFFFLVKH